MPSYEYPRPAVTVDAVVVRRREGAREVLLVRRGAEPGLGRWALPGGFVEEYEPLETAVRRELAEETGLACDAPARQVGAFGDPGRDPRGWTVGIAFLIELPEDHACDVNAGDDADEAVWHPVADLPPLAFDHDLIVATALKACR